MSDLSTGVYARVDEVIAEAPPDGAVDVYRSISTKFDPALFKPKLAPHVEIKVFRLKWGNDYAMVANTRDLIHYRLSPQDVDVIGLMDGTRTVKEIVVERFRDKGDLELTAVADLVRQLHEGNFLEPGFVDIDAAVKRAMNPVSGPRRKAQQFAKTLSIEWKNADRLVRFLYRAGFKWFFNPLVALATLVISVVGLVAFFADVRSGRFTLTGKSLAIGFLVLLALEYFMVFVHELGHALVLTHNRRRIKSAGFMIYFGSPAFFVDSSDGMMMERRQEVLASFAGPYAQLIVGGISAIVAYVWPAWILSETLYRYAVLNYWVVFMNLIPLLELDGYFILADSIQIPDLRERSIRLLQHDVWHKIRTRTGLTRGEVGLAVYGVLGLAFTIFSFYTSYFYWRSVFGGLVGRLWNGGTVTRAILVALAAFVAGPIIRGAINLARSLVRRLRLIYRRLKFGFEQKWRIEAAELIDKLPVFAPDGLPVEVLNDLAGRVKLRAFSEGQPVVRQGDDAHAFYVVRRGTLQVIEEDAATNNERLLRSLGRGESFGELGLLRRTPRTATVRAVEGTEVFEIDEGTFDQLLADAMKVPDYAPTIQTLAQLRELPPFQHLEPDELQQLLEHGDWVDFAPAEVVFEQGEVGDAFYVVGSGRMQVIEDDRLVRELGPGDYFGEIALLLDMPRTATVVAKTPARAFRLERVGFDRLIRSWFTRGRLKTSVGVDQVKRH